MKDYSTPEVQIIAFEAEDVITTSNVPPVPLPPDEF